MSQTPSEIAGDLSLLYRAMAKAVGEMPEERAEEWRDRMHDEREPQRVAMPRELTGDLQQAESVVDEIGARGNALLAAALTLGGNASPSQVTQLADQYLDWVLTTDIERLTPGDADEAVKTAAEHFAARGAAREAERMVPKG